MTPLAQKFGAGFSWLFAVATWIDGVQKHVTLIAGILAGILTLLLIWNAVLDNCKRRREERAAHRNELREIEDAVCKLRQMNGECMRCGWKPPKGEE